MVKTKYHAKIFLPLNFLASMESGYADKTMSSILTETPMTTLLMDIKKDAMKSLFPIDS